MSHSEEMTQGLCGTMLNRCEWDTCGVFAVSLFLLRRCLAVAVLRLIDFDLHDLLSIVSHVFLMAQTKSFLVGSQLQKKCLCCPIKVWQAVNTAGQNSKAVFSSRFIIQDHEVAYR